MQFCYDGGKKSQHGNGKGRKSVFQEGFINSFGFFILSGAATGQEYFRGSGMSLDK